jgi:ribosomal-protein-alanine N-acetyltransferase
VVPWTEEHFRTELEKPYSQVLLLTDDETDSKIGGYIVFWLMFDECQILDVATDLPFRGLGFAKRLVRQAVQQAQRKGITKIILEVRKVNAPAIQLYHGLGFVIRQIRKQFYSNGDDAYEMLLDLQTNIIGF